MTTTALTTSFLSTALISSDSQFRAKKGRCSNIRIASSVDCCSTSRCTSIGESGESGNRILCGRRGLVFMASLPCFLPLPADAAQLDGIDYSIMKREIGKVLSKGKAAGMLRLVFHDAGTYDTQDSSGGMNGSIILELDRPENTGLNKSVKIVKKAKSEVDTVIPVSWADMIAVAGAEAVSLCGGPTIPIRLGRMDSMEADPEGKLPEETLDASSLKQCFQQKGFSVQELVALSGAHTLGNKGFGNPTVFDNSYYKILLEKPWVNSGGMTNMIGLPTDRALAEDKECLRWIEKYANDQSSFFNDFSSAYKKLVNSGARWKTV
uniref:L-ascorbate peroxidase n=1 Tax=Sedum alfredii TaxID=439688 RepID=A0A650AVL0_9MAGN|nr:L-ascorbate peroxidase-like [Sedum alfredii]